jgi:uncharacterized protein YcbX
MPTLVRISTTPVKALRLSQTEEADLTEDGIPADRRFFLLEEDGRLVDASDHGPLLRVVSDYDAQGEQLRLTFPDGTVAEGPADRLGDPVVVDMFGHDAAGRLLLGPFAEALSGFVGGPVRIARTDRDGTGQDVHPLTIVSSASVRDLGQRGGAGDGLDPRRFRINLEVDGCDPYEEDTWAGELVRVGDATIRVLGQIPRCVITTLAPDTGEKDFRTLTVLAGFRPRIGRKGGLPFGMYAEVVEPGRARLGDAVELLSSSRVGTTPADGGP